MAKVPDILSHMQQEYFIDKQGNFNFPTADGSKWTLTPKQLIELMGQQASHKIKSRLGILDPMPTYYPTDA